MNRRTAALALAVLPAALLAACAGEPGETGSASSTTSAPSSASGSAELTIGLTYVPDVQFAPFYVAQDRGYYADAGVDVTLRHHGQQESLFGALEAGEEDLVVAGGDEMLQARAEGVDVVSVATLYQQYPVVLIVPAGSDITEPADLAGRTVGVPGTFGETWFGLLTMLDQAGLTQEDVNVETIGYTQQAALTAGHVDAVMGFVNNDVVRFGQAGIDVEAVPLADGEVPLVGIGLGARGDVLSQDEDAVAAVVAATLRGVEDVLADPDAALDITAEHVPGLTADRAAARAALDASAELYTADGAAPGSVDPSAWEAMAEFMAGAGLLGDSGLTVADAFRTDLVR